MIEIVLGIVIDEDNKHCDINSISYDIIGFAVLSLDDLSISFVEKNGADEKFILNESIIASKFKIYDSCSKYKIQNGYSIDRGYMLSSLSKDDDNYTVSTVPRNSSLPIYTNKLSLFTIIGEETMHFELSHHGYLVYNCRKHTLDVCMDNSCLENTGVGYFVGNSSLVDIQSAGNMFSSPFDGAYVYGDACWVIKSVIKSAIIPESISSLVLYCSHIDELVLPKSLESIFVDNGGMNPVDTYYLSKYAKLPLVCQLIDILSEYYVGEDDEAYPRFHAYMQKFISNKECEKAWEMCHSDTYKDFLDSVLRFSNIVIY